jgi:hypothetical protein
MKSIVVILIVFASSPVLFAAIGETEAASKAKAAQWKREYGAILPLFEVDSSGKVIQECWVAPAEEWTEAQAMELALKLLPESVRKTKPRRIEVDDSNDAFEVTSAYRVYLIGSPLGGFISVEVASSAYKGYRC